MKKTANGVSAVSRRHSRKNRTIQIEQVEIVRRQLEAPNGISKSSAKAMACPTYYAGQYLQPDIRPHVEHPLARAGKEFHAWREAYVNHLVEINKQSDPVFVEAYLAANHVSEDGRKLIQRDAERFTIDPQTVYAAELFLSIDHQFRPLELEHNRPPGSLSKHPDFLVSGQLDLLLMDGDVATIIDPKSGFSTSGVTDDEPPIYAALVMVHFPQVQTVRFQWDFVRVQAGRRAEYTREDLPWIESLIRGKNDEQKALVEKYNRGEGLGANPFAGLCPYCVVTCPLRPSAEAGVLAFPPPQTRADVVRIAQFLHVCESGIEQARRLVRAWLDQDLFGRVDLGGEWAAMLRVDERSTYPLVEALQALGLDISNWPKHSPYYDVPLDALTVSGISNFTKSKKSKKRADGGGISREGMKENLERIARKGAATVVVIKKLSQAEELAEIEARPAC